MSKYEDNDKRINTLEKEQAVQNIVLHEISGDLLTHLTKEEKFQEKIVLSLDKLNTKLDLFNLNVEKRLTKLELQHNTMRRIVYGICSIFTTVSLSAIGFILFK